MLRIALFIGTNLAIMVLLGLIASIFGYNRDSGLIGLLVMSAVIGMAGSFISLFLSKWMAKRSTGAQVIGQPRNEAEVWLFDTVRRQSEQAGIKMPEVAIFEAAEMNAFATGWNRNDSLVAVSTGLLRNMNRREVEAVLGHEISHVANGDMVTMTLIQGVLNTFVVFISNIVAQIVSATLRRDGEGRGVLDSLAHTVVYMVLQVVLGLFASIIVMWFSRRREFRADAGGATLSGRDNMISALRRLAGDPNDHVLPDQVKAMGISGERKKSGLAALFMTHPPLADRIAALEQMPRTNITG